MFKNLRIGVLLIAGGVAAILFAIPMLIFIRDSTFSQSWLLYLGNFLFMLAIAAYMIFFNKKKHEDASLLLAGHIVTVIGVVISAILSFIALSALVPGLFESGTPEKVLEEAPAQDQGRKTQGLVFMVMMNAIVGNVSTGSFVSIILAYYQKRDQTKEGIPLNEGSKV
jgi:hypothetical protein